MTERKRYLRPKYRYEGNTKVDLAELFWYSKDSNYVVRYGPAVFCTVCVLLACDDGGKYDCRVIIGPEGSSR
jgi:predicted nucleic acid-binding Zn finger protein